MGWQQSIIQRMIHSARPDGGWGYRAGMSVHTEPTALACLALSAQKIQSKTVFNSLSVLEKMQQSDGKIPVSSTVNSPGWTTGLCLLAWLSAGEDGERYANPIHKAVSWLLATRGKRMKPVPEYLGHNTTLQGWPWAEQTHSWVEPTAYAILALRATGYSDHPRIREGIKLLLDRALPDGGWNYGNTHTLGQILQPFPCTTGIVLAALAGEPGDKRIEESIHYLTQELPRIRSPLSLSWGLMGLSAWNARPRKAHGWLREAANHLTRREPNALHAAMLLLADAQHHPLISLPVDELHDLE